MWKTSIINAPCNSATDSTIISPAGRVVVRGWVRLRSTIIPSTRYTYYFLRQLLSIIIIIIIA